MLRIALISFLIVAVFATNEAQDEAAPATHVPKCDPTSEWGTYYEIGIEDYHSAFTSAFDKYVESGKQPKSSCSSSTRVSFNRYYKSYKDENLILFSYFCLDDRKYETLKATLSSDRQSGTGISVAKTLSDVGITGEHQYSGDAQTDEAAKTKIQELFDAMEDSMSPWDKCPGNFSTQTYPNLDTKSENDLNYYQFKLACVDATGEPAKMFVVQVAVDDTCEYYNEGKPILVGRLPPSPNTDWLDEFWTGMQKDSTITVAPSSFFSLILLAAYKALIQ